MPEHYGYDMAWLEGFGSGCKPRKNIKK